MEPTTGREGKPKRKRILSDVTKQKNKERRKNWKKNSKKERIQLETELQTAMEEKRSLEVELGKARLQIDQLKHELDKLDGTLTGIWNRLKIVDKIAENGARLVQDLPPNSPFRRPLLAYLTAGLETQPALEFFGISLRTFNRIKEDSTNSLLEIKYTVGVTRSRVSQEQLDEIKRILEDILPKQSGRDFRNQEVTDKKLYETYQAEVKGGAAVSKSFFIYTVLAAEKIHRSKRPKFCPLCEEYEGGNHSHALQRHKDLIPIQRGQYSLEKKKIAEGVTPLTALVTQDFSQILYEGGFTQDLIVCIYTHDSAEKDGLRQYYRHFVGNSSDKNDISFVVGCWKILLEEDKFNGMEMVKIWSDGGPKHFKISANIKFLLSLQQSKSEIIWEYNFFPSYHGCSVCDGAASHFKQLLNRTMRDDHVAIRSPEQVVTAGAHLNHHEVTMAAVASTNLSSVTLKGIKKYHKFTTSKEKNIIYAYSDSKQVEYDHRYLPRDVVQLDDIEFE
jgi:hypothetical protein